MIKLAKYKTIKHEVIGDAPFVGALICACDCKFKCRGCFNKHIKKAKPIEKDVKDIIGEIKANPLNKGVIFGGLEWSLQPTELLNLIEEATKQDLEIIIYTGCDTVMEFHERIGKEVVRVSKVGNMIKDDEHELIATIGSSMIDYYTPNGYYIKCGKYDANKKVKDNIQFGVKLATSNQFIAHIVEPEDYKEKNNETIKAN